MELVLGQIRREKVHLAVKRTCEMYDELGLTMEERKVVSRSTCIAATVALLKEQVDSEAEEMIQKEKETAASKIMKMLPTITSTAAILISIASLLAKLLL